MARRRVGSSNEKKALRGSMGIRGKRLRAGRTNYLNIDRGNRRGSKWKKEYWGPFLVRG